ncbi:transposase [Streptomyces sp. NPDC002133]|uniref:transposase n=1 Tax=Streptomyces sp. NPDC002133 TaxID=3154409 RepID=UPI003323CA1C
MVELAGYPGGTRITVRRERPHRRPAVPVRPGRGHAPPDLPHQPPLRAGTLRHLKVRHRAQSRVEDRSRCSKTTGLGRLPSCHCTLNQVWLELALTATDLLAWTQTLLLEGELAAAEPEMLRYRLLHAAARITRGAAASTCASAQLALAKRLVNAFARLTALSRPAT